MEKTSVAQTVLEVFRKKWHCSGKIIDKFSKLLSVIDSICFMLHRVKFVFVVYKYQSLMSA